MISWPRYRINTDMGFWKPGAGIIHQVVYWKIMLFLAV